MIEDWRFVRGRCHGGIAEDHAEGGADAPLDSGLSTGARVRSEGEPGPVAFICGGTFFRPTPCRRNGKTCSMFCVW
jgi:hypothetical protein